MMVREKEEGKEELWEAMVAKEPREERHTSTHTHCPSGPQRKRHCFLLYACRG
jgi:hypothetical protein